MASRDEEMKQMMRTLIEQQAEMIKLMRLTTTPPPNPSPVPRPNLRPTFRPQTPSSSIPQLTTPDPSSVPRPTFLLPSQPTFRPQTSPTYHHQPPPTFHPQPPPVPHPRPSRPSQPHPKPHQPRPGKARSFHDLWKPASEILSESIKKGILKPVHPRPPPSPLPPHFNPSQYCAFHQNVGHSTNNCKRLRHAIQNLIDDGIITPPKEHTNSSTIHQPSTSSVHEAQGGECVDSARKRKRT